MPGRRVASLALSLGALLALPALAADNAPLDLKPGLWEMTSDSEQSGTPPIPPEVLDKMSPEQRAKLEAVLQQSMGPQHRVLQHCVTQSDIDQGFAKLDRMGRGKCTQTVTSSTSTLRTGTFTCSGAEQASGTYRVEAHSPEALAATWDVTVSNGDKAIKMKNALQGKWLGADCGSATPEK